jgi:hypothetical protein
LLGLAGCVQATFEERPSDWLSICVQANYLGMAAARAGVQHMLHDNCQWSQVVMGLQGGDPFPQYCTQHHSPFPGTPPPHHIDVSRVVDSTYCTVLCSIVLKHGYNINVFIHNQYAVRTLVMHENLES